MADAPPNPAPSPAAAPHDPRRRTWRRRLLKLAIGALIGLLLVIVGVQLFLWSGYPRQIGITIAQRITGLRVEMGSLSIGWGGATSITDLAVALPLADRPFLVVPRVDVQHTSLVGIVLTQDVVIRRVAVERPAVDVRQDASGAWNLQQALQQISGPAQNVATVEPEARGEGNIYLPDIQLDQATVAVTLNNGRSTKIENVSLKATHENALLWKFDAKADTFATASGSVTPVGRWPHAVHIEVDPGIAEALRPLAGDLLGTTDAPQSVRVNADWSGERTATGVTGRLTLPGDGAEAGVLRAGGAAIVTLDGGDLLVEPDGLKVRVPAVPLLDLAGGRIHYAGSRLAIEQLRVRFAGGSVRLDADGDLSTQQARADLSWERVAYPPATQHQGRIVANVASIWPGKPQVSAQLDTRGTAAGRDFDLDVRLAGAGPRWTDAEYVIELARTRLSRDRGISAALQGTRIVLHNTADLIELLRIESPATDRLAVDARGAYRFSGEGAGNWWLWSAGRAAGPDQQDLLASLNLYGDHASATLESASATLGADVWASATGGYRYGDEAPVQLQLDLEADPNAAADAEQRDQLEMRGRLGASARISGTVNPLRLQLNGHARSRQFAFRKFDLGDLALGIKGVLHEDYLDVETTDLRLLGGTGWLAVRYPYDENDLVAQLTLGRISLKQAGEVGGVEGLDGTLDGRLTFNVPIRSPLSLHGGGELTIDSLVAPMVLAERVQMPLRVQDEWIHLLPEATQEKGGTARLELVSTFAEPTRVETKAALNNWLTVLPLRDLYTRTSGMVELAVDAARQSANGTVSLDTDFGAHQSAIGSASLQLGVSGRTLHLERLTGELLDGVIFGQGTVNTAEPETSRLSLGVDGINLDRLAQLAPQVGDVRGGLTVRLHAEPTREKRALGPLEARLTVESQDATYKGVGIGDTRVRAFIDRDRLVLSDDPAKPNQIALAGGTVRLWGRLSGMPLATDPAKLLAGDAAATAKPRQPPSAFLQLRPDGLDIEQLNRIIDPAGKPVPGRVSGEITVFGNPMNHQALTASGRLSITRSDFADVGILRLLYEAMRLGMAPTEPNGYGEIAFRLQGGELVVPTFTYFNRGVYATASLTLKDVFALRESPVSGPIVGTLRPLKDLEIPFLADLDQIGDALQRNATTLLIDGTIAKPKAIPATLSQFGADFRNLLLGQTGK